MTPSWYLSTVPSGLRNASVYLQKHSAVLRGQDFVGATNAGTSMSHSGGILVRTAHTRDRLLVLYAHWKEKVKKIEYGWRIEGRSG